MRVRYFDSVKSQVLSSRADIVPKNPWKPLSCSRLKKKHEKIVKTRFKVSQKDQVTCPMPRVVWAEESKTGLGFEIGPRQQQL